MGGRAEVHGDVVEESGGAGAGSDQQAGGAGGGRRSQIGIGEFEVVLNKGRFGAEHRTGRGQDRVGALRTGGGARAQGGRDGGSGVIGINGAAAHLVHPGDLVIMISYGVMDETEAKSYIPKVVHVDGANRIVELGGDPSAPVPGATDMQRSDLGVPIR